jgi:hypothetical protein
METKDKPAGSRINREVHTRAMKAREIAMKKGDPSAYSKDGWLSMLIDEGLKAKGYE